MRFQGHPIPRSIQLQICAQKQHHAGTNNNVHK